MNGRVVKTDNTVNKNLFSLIKRTFDLGGGFLREEKILQSQSTSLLVLIIINNNPKPWNPPMNPIPLIRCSFPGR